VDSRGGGAPSEKTTKKEIKGKDKTVGGACQSTEIGKNKDGRRTSLS
jgi:hypothetical protein